MTRRIPQTGRSSKLPVMWASLTTVWNIIDTSRENLFRNPYRIIEKFWPNYLRLMQNWVSLAIIRIMQVLVWVPRFGNYMICFGIAMISWEPNTTSGMRRWKAGSIGHEAWI